MECLHFCLLLLCLLNIIGFINTCGEHQQEIKGVCCDRCQPGFFMETSCSVEYQTKCERCPPGSFSEKPNVFDRCEKCRTCDREYSQECTNTTDAKCSCGAGFLCSDNICSKCEANKCISGERLKTTAVVVNIYTNLTKYTYACEPLCRNYEYYNEKDKVCEPRTRCSAHGLVEIFAGNKTHDAKCHSHEMQKVYIIVIAGFVLFVVTSVVVLSYFTSKKIKKIRASQAVNNNSEVKVSPSECFALSMEETAGPVEDKEDSFG